MTDLFERVRDAIEPIAQNINFNDMPDGFYPVVEAIAYAAIAEVRRFDVERGPTDAEIERAALYSHAGDRSVLDPDEGVIKMAELMLRAAAKVRAEEVGRMTVTDAMVEAGMTAFVKTRAWRDREDQAIKADGKPSMRAAIEAALAVQPVPTDAEIKKAIGGLKASLRCLYTECSGFAVNIQNRVVEQSEESLLRLIAQQREAAGREALEAGLKAARGAFGLLSESAFAYETGVSGDGETMHADYVPLGIITAMSEAFGTDRWVPFLIEHGFVANEDEYALLAKEDGDE